MFKIAICPFNYRLTSIYLAGYSFPLPLVEWLKGQERVPPFRFSKISQRPRLFEEDSRRVVAGRNYQFFLSSPLYSRNNENVAEIPIGRHCCRGMENNARRGDDRSTRLHVFVSGEFMTSELYWRRPRAISAPPE